VVVAPFFLGPGKHWTSDIPRLTREAADQHPGTRYHVTPTLGIDDLILDLLDKRASHCVQHGLSCDVCRGTLRSGEPGVAAEPAPAAPTHAPEPKTNAVLCGTCPFRETTK
jgi:sirohydrochlorin ferrochelatase